MSSAALSSRAVRRWCRFGSSSSGLGALSTSTPRRATLTRMRAQNFHPGACRGTTGASSPMAGQPTWARSVHRSASVPRRTSGAARRVRVTMGRCASRRTTVSGSRSRWPGPGPGSCSCTGSAARRRTSPTTCQRSRATTPSSSFDHRGHGESDKPDDPLAYSLDRLVADTLAVADAVGLSRFRLLGHSMGGMVARRIVLGHPDRVDALVLMDTAPGPIPGLRPGPHGDRRGESRSSKARTC